MCTTVAALQVLVLAVVPHVHGYRGGRPGHGDTQLLKQKVEAEAEIVEKEVEAVAGKLGGADVVMKPIKGSFQVGEPLGKVETKKKAVLSIWVESPASASTAARVEAKMRAKDEGLGAKFVKTLTTRLAQLAAVGVPPDFPPDFLTASLQGDEVTLTSMPLKDDPAFTHALERLAKHIDHADVTDEAPDVDFVGMLKDHSGKLVLQELYHHMRVSIDAALTPALEEALSSLVTDDAVKGTERLLLRLFQGLFFDVRVQYNGEAVQDALGSVPGLNMTAADLVAAYRELGQQIPKSQRGLPVHVTALDVLQEADDCLVDLSSLEFKGLPAGVRFVMKFEHTNFFETINTFVKEAGIDKILRDETAL